MCSSSLGAGSVVEDDWEEGDSVEADGVMEIVTECWVEPQNGVVVSPSPRANHLNNCNYRQLAQAVSTYLEPLVFSRFVFSVDRRIDTQEKGGAVTVWLVLQLR